MKKILFSLFTLHLILYNKKKFKTNILHEILNDQEKKAYHFIEVLFCSYIIVFLRKFYSFLFISLFINSNVIINYISNKKTALWLFSGRKHLLSALNM